MVVVTADHGISFQGRSVYRRIAEPENLGGVANPPLFIKYPGQRRGGISPIHSRSIDIVPTIAQQLGIENMYRSDGRPISEDGRGGPVEIVNGQQDLIRMPLAQLVQERRAVVAEAFFRLGDGPLGALGPGPTLLGRPAPPLAYGIAPESSATVENESAYEDFDPATMEVPAFVAGTLEGVPSGVLIAIAVNGRVAATARAFLDAGTVRYAAVVPVATLIPGRNAIGIYRVAPRGRLLPLGGN
jgi:hypothetical protein